MGAIPRWAQFRGGRNSVVGAIPRWAQFHGGRNSMVGAIPRWAQFRDGRNSVMGAIPCWAQSRWAQFRVGRNPVGRNSLGAIPWWAQSRVGCNSVGRNSMGAIPWWAQSCWAESLWHNPIWAQFHVHQITHNELQKIKKRRRHGHLHPQITQPLQHKCKYHQQWHRNYWSKHQHKNIYQNLQTPEEKYRKLCTRYHQPQGKIQQLGNQFHWKHEPELTHIWNSCRQQSTTT